MYKSISIVNLVVTRFVLDNQILWKGTQQARIHVTLGRLYMHTLITSREDIYGTQLNIESPRDNQYNDDRTFPRNLPSPYDFRFLALSYLSSNDVRASNLHVFLHSFKSNDNKL